MAVFTSKANGNWATSGQVVWNEAGVPGSGDTVTITHAITITAATTIGDGTASVVLTCLSGSLTITGATLTIRGQSLFGQYAGGTLSTRLTISNSGATPGGIEFDGNSGVTPVMSIDYDTNVAITGISSAHCFIRTKSGSAGVNGYMTSYASHARTFYMTATYCDFARLGDATNNGIAVTNLNGIDITGGSPAFSLNHCTIDNCGVAPYIVIVDGAAIVSLTNSVWTNPLASDYQFNITVSALNPNTTGTRIVDHCQFFGNPRPNWRSSAANFTVTNNYFDDAFEATESGTVAWDSFDGNFIRKQTADECEVAGSVTNCYLLGQPVSDPGGFTGFHTTNNVASSYLNNVYQYVGSRTDSVFLSTAEGGVVAHDIVIKGNIILPQGSDTSGLLAEFFAPPAQTGDPSITCEHNTVCVGSEQAVKAGRTVGIKAGIVVSYRANCFWRSGGAVAGTYAFSNVDPSPNTDVVTAAHCDYNGWFGLAAVPGGTWSDIADGTVYSTPMSGGTAPGVHDAANVDPGFVDSTRNLQTWSVSKGYSSGGDSNTTKITNALAAIQANIALVKNDLLPYVQAGFVTTSSAYQASSYPGDTLTVDASGNSWGGGAPGIGAMSGTPVVVASSRAGPPYPSRLTNPVKPVAAGWV